MNNIAHSAAMPTTGAKEEECVAKVDFSSYKTMRKEGRPEIDGIHFWRWCDFLDDERMEVSTKFKHSYVILIFYVFYQ